MQKKFHTDFFFFSPSMCLRVSEQPGNESSKIICLASICKVSYNAFQNTFCGVSFGGFSPPQESFCM